MKLTADTNILVRIIAEDDPKQARLAQKLVEQADLVSIPLPALVETCWVLERAYNLAKSDVANALRVLIAADNVAADYPAVEAGIAILEAGGDFADGVIAQDGLSLGATIFASFDRKAVKLLKAAGFGTYEPGQVG